MNKLIWSWWPKNLKNEIKIDESSTEEKSRKSLDVVHICTWNDQGSLLLSAQSDDLTAYSKVQCKLATPDFNDKNDISQLLENDQPPNCCDLQVNRNNAIKKATSKQFKQNEWSTGHSHRPLNYWQLCTCARLPLAIVCAWYTQKRLLELHERSVFDLEWRRHKMHKTFMRRNSLIELVFR